MTDVKKLVRFVQTSLKQQADREKAAGMQAYMKTDMPFYGVQKPARQAIVREAKRKFPIEKRADYRAAVEALWNLEHREEKYIALSIARAWPTFIEPGMVPFYKRLITEGAWWDFVDEVATQIISPMYLEHRSKLRPTMEKWIDEKNMWLRRSAILSHIKHKRETDEDQLFRFCLKRADEDEFFIRKAIGWVLREYAYSSPRSVMRFLKTNRDVLSKLTFREAAKHLNMR